jgi:hypothetical protein
MFLKKIIKNRVVKKYLSLARELAAEKYKVFDTCIVSSPQPGYLSYEMGDGTRSTVKNDLLACGKIRSQCGQHTLIRYGIPASEDMIPQVILLPTLSMIKELGFVETTNFFANWKGDSKVNEAIVVKYSLLF